MLLNDIIEISCHVLNDIIEISCHAFERYYRDIMSCF